MLISFFLLLIFVVCVAMMWNEGLWSNAVTLVNVTLAGLVATNYFEPLASFLEKQLTAFTYVVDFLAIWILFCLVFSILRGVTSFLSRYRVRFKMPVEQVGRVFFALWAAWIVVCFVDTTLHTAPLPRHSFGGSFQKTPTSGNFFGLSPSRQWLGFVQSRSRGALARGIGSAEQDTRYDDGNRRVFDPNSAFMIKYGYRRELLTEHNREQGTVTIRPSE